MKVKREVAIALYPVFLAVVSVWEQLLLSELHRFDFVASKDWRTIVFTQALTLFYYPVRRVKEYVRIHWTSTSNLTLCIILATFHPIYGKARILITEKLHNNCNFLLFAFILYCIVSMMETTEERQKPADDTCRSSWRQKSNHSNPQSQVRLYVIVFIFMSLLRFL